MVAGCRLVIGGWFLVPGSVVGGQAGGDAVWVVLGWWLAAGWWWLVAGWWLLAGGWRAGWFGWLLVGSLWGGAG